MRGILTVMRFSPGSAVGFSAATFILLLLAGCSSPYLGEEEASGAESRRRIPYTLSVSWVSDGEDRLARVETSSEEPNARASSVPNEILVKYRDGVIMSQSVRGGAQRFGRVLTVASKPGLRVSRVRVDEPGRTVAEAVRYFESLPEVEYAEPNYRRRILAPVNDPYYKFQWNLSQLRMPEVWEVVTGSPEVVVAVIDTGVRRSLDDLADTSFVDGYDFIDDDTTADDENGHGSHVTGTIAQSTDNGMGTAGMAYGVSIMPLKIFGADGTTGTVADLVEAVEWAVDNGADVINLSLGGGTASETENDAMRYAYENGVAVVAASGNSNGAVTYPAANDEYVLAVGATDYGKSRAPYSNFGPELDVVAPGGDLSEDLNDDENGDGILQQTFDTQSLGPGSTSYTGTYYFFEGTSMAAPHVTALAALLLSSETTLTPETLYQRIRETADDLGPTGHDEEYGYGLINPLAALTGTTAPPPSGGEDADSDDTGSDGAGGEETGGSADDGDSTTGEPAPVVVSRQVSGTVDAAVAPAHRWRFEADPGEVEISLEFPAGEGDLDLYVRGPDDTPVTEVTGAGAGTGSPEVLRYSVDAAGSYTVDVRIAR